jgi:hypothetical protein
MTEQHTGFDILLETARDLAITVVSGKLWPPLDGRMWIGARSLDEILCPNHSERQVAIVIAPGGPGSTHIHAGQGSLYARDLNRLAQEATTVGGSFSHGWLAVLTPEMWLQRHDNPPHGAGTRATLDAATATGWPASFGDGPVLFLDDHSIYSLLAQANVGRTVTLLVGTIAA